MFFGELLQTYEIDDTEDRRRGPGLLSEAEGLDLVSLISNCHAAMTFLLALSLHPDFVVQSDPYC